MRGDGSTGNGALGTDPRSRAAAWIAIALLAAGLWTAFSAVDAWAGLTFARPELGALLAGAIELALFALAFVVAPPLSRLVESVVRAAVK